MDNKSLIIGILIIIVVVLGIGVVLTFDSNTDNINATNNTTNNSTNGSGNITPVPSPTPVNNTTNYISAAQAIRIAQANVPDAMAGSFSAFLTTNAGRAMYKVSYVVTEDIGYDTRYCFVDAITGQIYGQYL